MNLRDVQWPSHRVGGGAAPLYDFQTTFKDISNGPMQNDEQWPFATG
jgi:hypothetical protein